MSAFRPLPARPSLEFERKEAKALLRLLRAGDPDAIARAGAHHPTFDPNALDRVRLADAQLVIAREYGFASWPRLVRYFGDLERVAHAHPSSASLPPSTDFWDHVARSLLTGHQQRRRNAGRALAAYVPRFYGKPLDEVFAAEVAEAEACLATARMRGFPSWDALLQRVAAERRSRPSEWEVDPMRPAFRAIEAGDLDALKRVVEAHPDLLHPSDWDEATGHTLLRSAIHHDRRQGSEAMRPTVEWLATQGLDFQQALNRQLCGHIHMTAEKVRWLLDRGADPNWVAPNGIPALEHALIRYWSGEAVDVLAARATPRRALWIAAGLGDVDGVRRFLDDQGRPTRAARRLRPDFAAVGQPDMPALPDPDDEEILLEAFHVAALNGRTTVLEYMAQRGFDVNARVWDSPLLNMAVGNAWIPIVECLLRCGADPDLKGSHPDMSAREIARELFEQDPRIVQRRRIVELLGMDPDAILAERDAGPVTPAIGPEVQQALDLAGDDAFRLSQTDIRPENLLFGLLRADRLGRHFFTATSRMDVDRFRAELADRLRRADDRIERPRLPVHQDAQVVLQEATAIAAERRRETVEGQHLLYALTRPGHGVAGELLARYGSSAAGLNTELEKAL